MRSSGAAVILGLCLTLSCPPSQTKDREVEAICQADATLGGDLSCSCPEACCCAELEDAEKEEALVEHRTRWPAIFAEISFKLPGR